MIILTGGAGFIGSNFLKLLNQKGYNDVIIVDNLSNTSKWKNLVGKRFKYYINKTEFLKNLDKLNFSNTEAIFHFGACSSTSEQNIDYLFSNNLEYSKKLAKKAIDNNIPFIYASSAATYGNGDQGYSDNVYYDLRPLNAYGFSKHLFDLWVIEKGYDELFIGLKFFNVFGPNEYHKNEMASMVYKAFNQVKNSGRVKLFRSYNDDFEDGEQLRDFVYIDDAVNLTWQLFEKRIKGIFNIGTGTTNTWNSLAEHVFNTLQKPVNIEYVDMPEQIKNQYQYSTKADISKLFESGIKYDFLTFEQSIKKYINNYLNINQPYL